MKNATVKIAGVTGMGVLDTPTAEFGYVDAASPDGDIQLLVPAATARQVAAAFDVMASVLERERKRLGLETAGSGIPKEVAALELFSDPFARTVTLRTRYEDETSCDTPLDREKILELISYLAQALVEFDSSSAVVRH